jgi:Cu+-exporting ATPase
LSSEHPIGAAVVRAARARKLPLLPVTEFRAVVGGGVTGRNAEGGRVDAGSVSFLRNEAGVDAANLEAWEAQMAQQWTGRTGMLVARERRILGAIGIDDPVKPSSAGAVAALHAMGLRVVMLTGDQPAVAARVAAAVGIEEWMAEVRSEQKLARVEALQREGRRVAMAGDGINDAPALAQAEVGIAMSTGTDVAIESAGMTLLHGDLRGLVRAIRLSRATMRNIRQNLFFAFVYNLLGVPVAAGVLYPWLGVLLSPMIAGAAMSFSSVSVIANALRLRRVRLDGE